MVKALAGYNYYVVQDSFTLLFPEDTYTIEDLYNWYELIPTEPKKIGYYGTDKELLKRHLERLLISDEVKTRKTNTLHAEDCLNVNVLVAYTRDGKCVAFAAQEWRDNWGKEKRILFLKTLVN